MIIRKLTIENFRQIYGKHEIGFALPGDRNVTVVLGQNGAGKTTMLNAFVWCLYGQLHVENPGELVSHKAAQETDVGAKVQVEVTLLLQDGVRFYTVKRRTVFEKQDGGILAEVAPNDLRVDVMDSNGVTTVAPDPRQLIQQILPEGLRGFFFFRGEDMETMALQSSGPELSKGVKEFLNLMLLERAIKHLEQTGKDFENELGRIAVGDTKKLVEDISQAEADLEDATAKLNNEEANVRDLDARRDKIEQQLAELDEVRPLLEEKARLINNRQSLERQEAEQRASLAGVVSRDGFLFCADQVLNEPVRLANDAVKRGELPTKIKPKFVEDLLGLGKCICGRELDEGAQQELIRWRGLDGLASLEESINDLRNSAAVLQTRQTRFKQDIDKFRAMWASTKDQIRKTIEAISNVDSQLQGKDFGLEEVRALQGKLRQVNDELIQRSSDVAAAKESIKVKTAKLELLRSERKHRLKDESAAGLIQKRFDATVEVASALRKMRDGWLAIVQQYLDGQLKQNWSRVAQLERLVEFTKDFTLNIKERGPDGKWTISAPSSANLRALALCFVSALIKLAHDIGIEERQRADQGRRQNMFQGGDYPLVMDAPFSTMDKHFKTMVPSGLREVVPQIILMTNHDQWTGAVEDALRQFIGEGYVLELHLNKGEDSSINWNGTKVDYVVAEPEATTDWSVFRKVSQ